MDGLYESPKVLAEYLLFHYAENAEVLPATRTWPYSMREALGFPARTAAYFGTNEVATGLDLGCAVGRATIEMAKHCRQVLGIDFSHSFIHAAQQIAAGEAITYERLEEGHQSTPLEAMAPPEANLSRVSFQQGDAMHLPDSLGLFDRVHAANLLCRLPDPMRFLQRMPSLVAPGGELILATPGTWLEDFTPKELWPNTSTADWLQHQLEPHFALAHQAEEPFLIRETARKFQWSWSLVSVWRRR